jgi:hypothetical protein
MKGDALWMRSKLGLSVSSGISSNPRLQVGGSARGVQEGREEGWRWKASVRPVLVTEAPQPDAAAGSVCKPPASLVSSSSSHPLRLPSLSVS